jgi:StAR-related lipid transfer protein 10
MLKLGEVKQPTDENFDFIRTACDDDSDWTLVYNKSKIKIFVKQSPGSSFQMIKAKADFDDVPAHVLYDTIQDVQYQKCWDDSFIENVDVCHLSPYSDIGYFACKSPKPFKNRDFVTQRCWLDFGDNRDKIMFNHSVNHVKYPPRKNFVRGVSYLSATICRPTSLKTSSLIYITHGDPGGTLPSWAVNMASKVLAPKVINYSI